MPFNLITDLTGKQPDIQDRALHYGDGVFETLLLKSGELIFWDSHYRRLSSSADRLFIACPEKTWLEANLAPYIEMQQDLVIKIILSRGCGGRGLEWPDNIDPNIYIMHYPHNLEIKKQYVKAVISSVTLPKNRSLAGLKHLNRLNYVLATQALKQFPDYNEALLCDSDSYLIEGIINNVFFVIGNEICTPDLSESGVEGICRQLVIERLRSNNIEVKIDRFARQAVLTASECFLCNSVQGITPVIQIEDVNFDVGPVTQQLQQAFYDFTSH